MEKEKKQGKHENKKGGIKIDYDNIDVVDIMDQIKKKIAKEPKKPPVEYEIPPSPLSQLEAEYQTASLGIKGKMKRLLLKIMRPISPLIKVIVLPVHEEVMETNRSLHRANLRLDSLEMNIGRLEDILNKIMEYTKLLHNLSHNIVVELSKLKIEEEGLKLKTQIMEKDFNFLEKRERALEKDFFK